MRKTIQNSSTSSLTNYQLSTVNSQLPRGWEIKKLGEVIKLEYGKPLDKSLRITDGKYPVYGANGIKARTNDYYFNKKTIVVGRKGSAGEINITEEKFWPLDVTYFVKYDNTKLDLYFLYFLLAKLELTKLAKGVKPGINRNDVYSLDVVIPPLPEQKRIVAILDKTFTAIDQAKANAQQNLKNTKELFESYLQEVFENKGEDWEKSELNEYVNFIDYRGRTPKKVETGIRLITAKNIKKGFIQKSPEEFIAINDYEKWMTRGIPKKGDVLFTTEAPLANVAQLDTDEKVAFAQRTIIFQPNPKIIFNTFLKYLLLSKIMQDKIISQGTGATVKGIKSRLLKKIKIFYPNSIKIQKQIVKKLDALQAETEKLEAIYQKKISNLEELKKSILQKAFTGEL